MTVGYPLTKGTLDNRIGHLIVQSDQLLTDWERLYELINSSEGDDATLGSMGYSTQDIALIKAIVFAWHDLNQVARGQKTQPEANNYFFYAKMVRGVE
jgi:hypothetical protein